ncbi:hypothetical protein TTHERM_000538929 (macronuclear) [Tetrahymena thermophila SB210]|uniref:Uncharacterized protein n=1 Tax=Tetrahymena thermophila (strain SB210) TaxID=312017 RepID=W7XAM9_TETTS|nr:hypothetical protein TTHERM_000538929 [Tetrahymena thermophila SB210]EWS76420.1 hypothetical protein TTHERM_000538929 [Tetrahymena thermophila SB210]|eukprot:XP_012651044.1 hypothetical protein TTHERM_000538929 [Tetrahymena thermophila SB210]
MKKQKKNQFTQINFKTFTIYKNKMIKSKSEKEKDIKKKDSLCNCFQVGRQKTKISDKQKIIQTKRIFQHQKQFLARTIKIKFSPKQINKEKLKKIQIKFRQKIQQKNKLFEMHGSEEEHQKISSKNKQKIIQIQTK